MIEKTVRCVLTALGLLASMPGTGAETAAPVPLITFGPGAGPNKGDDDFTEDIQIQIPSTISQRLYLRVFDPDVGDTGDEPTGPWNTRTEFSLRGAGDTVLLDAVFAQDQSVDGQWRTLGSFMAKQGEPVGDGYRFRFQAAGLEGDDGNLFDLAVSTDPDVNQPAPGTRMSSQHPTISVAPEHDRIAEAQFFIPAGTTALTIRNFDLDRARSEMQRPFVAPQPLSISNDGNWREDRIRLDPSAKDRKGALVVRGGRTLRNNLVLEVRDGNGTVLPIRLPVRSFPRGNPPRPAAEHTIDADCRTVLFDASKSSDDENALIDYLWDFGDGQAGSGRRVTHRYAEPGTYAVELTVVDDSGQVADRARRSYSVTVNQTPEAVPGPRQIAAPGERVRFDAGASQDRDGRIKAFAWDFGDGHRGKGKRASHAYAKPGVYSARLRVEDDGPGPCRSAEAATEIWVNAPPTAAAGADRAAAAGATLHFDASASRDPDGTLRSFHWDLGDGQEATGTSVEHAYATPGTYRVTLRVEDDAVVGNSLATDQLLVTINDPPLAVANGSTRGAVAETLTFDASGSRDPDGSILDYAWDFGDGQTTTGVKVAHAYDKPGTYPVSLKVRDDSGTASETASAQLFVVINDPPVPDAGNDLHLTASEIEFNASGSRDPDGEILSWRWDFGDGTNGQGPQPRHVYAAPGRYLVKLTVTDDSQTASASAADTLDLIINAKPVADAGPDRIAAPGQTLDFDASGSFDPDGTIASYRWDFGDGAGADGAKAEHAYEKPGHYNVHLEVRDDSGHPQVVGFADAEIWVNAPPVAIAGPDRLVAPGQEIVLDGSASHDPDGEIVSYRWSFSDGVGTTENVLARRAFPAPGSFTADLGVTDDSGAANANHRDGLLIRVNHPPTAVAGAPIRTCSPWVELDGSASRDPDGDRLRYSWAFGDDSMPADGPRVSHRFAEPGRFPVVLTVDDRTGLDNAIHRATTEARVYRAPVAVAEGPALACAGEVLLFNGNGSYDPDGGPLLYHWDFGDGTKAHTASPAKSYEQPGSYRVELRVEDDSGLPSCNSARDRIAVIVADAPVADAGEDHTLCANTPVTFDGSGSRDFDGVVNSYHWDFGDGSGGGGPNPTHLYAEPGDYRVTLTVTGDRVGECANHHSDQIRVRVLAAPRVSLAAPARASLGETVTFLANVQAENERVSDELTYHWELGDGNRAEGQRVEHRFGAPGRYLIAMTAQDSSGGECAEVRVEHALLINAPPRADAGKDLVTAPGEILVLDGSASSDPDGVIASYQWDFGDGTQAEGVQVVHRYAEPGTYAASLRISDDSGLKSGFDQATRTIRVNAPPRIQLALDPPVPCRGEELLLDATQSSDPDGTLQDWSWDLGDGVTAHGARITHSYSKPGLYPAALTVADETDVPNSRTQLVREIRVNSPPGAAIDAPRSGCPGKPLVFDASRSTDSDGEELRYRWTFGDGGDGTGIQVSHTYADAGHYLVTLEVTDGSDSSCQSTQNRHEVRINTPPRAAIEAPTGPLLLGGAQDAVLLDATASRDPDGDPLTFRWNLGDGTQGKGPKVTHPYDQPGRYRVDLEVRDGTGDGCDLGTDQLEIEVHEHAQRP